MRARHRNLYGMVVKRRRGRRHGLVNAGLRHPDRHRPLVGSGKAEPLLVKKDQGRIAVIRKIRVIPGIAGSWRRIGRVWRDIPVLEGQRRFVHVGNAPDKAVNAALFFIDAIFAGIRNGLDGQDNVIAVRADRNAILDFGFRRGLRFVAAGLVHGGNDIFVCGKLPLPAPFARIAFPRNCWRSRGRYVRHPVDNLVTPVVHPITHELGRWMVAMREIERIGGLGV